MVNITSTQESTQEGAEALFDLGKTAVDLAVEYVPGIVAAIVVLIIGLWVIKIIGKVMDKALVKSKMDSSLRHFLESLVRIGLKLLLLISVVGMLGVETSSFVAILAAMGFAIGLALQGSLANFAGGVLILLFKPFKVGDFIETQGHSGSVSKIEIFNTVLKTGDNKTIIIPNGPVANGDIVNYSTEDKRRVDMTFGISYDDDIKKAKDTLHDIVMNDDRVLRDPAAPMIAVGNLGASSVDINVRVWVKSSDYWGVFFDMQETVKQTFDKKGLNFPYQTMDVNVHKK